MSKKSTTNRTRASDPRRVAKIKGSSKRTAAAERLMKGPGRKLLNKATGSRALKPKIGPAAAAKAPPDDLETVAHSDTDNRPLTRKDFARMRRVPRVKIIRQALGLTQEEFAERYRIPIGTLRDWEQGRSQPDQPARAYLKVIAAYPDMAAKAHHKAA